MKMIWLCGIGDLSLLYGAPSAADVVTDFSRCLKKHYNVSSEGSPCGRIFQRATDGLAGALVQARADIRSTGPTTALSTPTGPIALFEREQATWEQYRQFACKVYADRDRFGTIGRDILGPECLVQVMHARTRQLQVFSDNF